MAGGCGRSMMHIAWQPWRSACTAQQFHPRCAVEQQRSSSTMFPYQDLHFLGDRGT